MAKLPAPEAALVDAYGPHLKYEPPGGWRDGVDARPPDRLVKTHCCFCGQQCGIQLKVRDNQVVGFEPWEDFPFNQGMLCPKGVKRYMQASHPDRLLAPARAHGRPASAGDLGRGARLSRRGGCARSRTSHGKDAVAMYGGASLTTEKAYLLGQVRAGGPGHAPHRLQRPALHGVRGRRLQARARRRPLAQPLGGHPEGAGGAGGRRERRPIARPSPPTTSGEMRDHGGKLIVVGPADDAHHAQRRPVPARPPGHRHRALPGHPARRPPRRPRGSGLHRRPHHGLRGGGRLRAGVEPPARGRGHGRAPGVDREGGPLVRRGRARDGHARPRHRAHSPRGGELLVAAQPVPGHRPRRPTPARAA